MENKNFEIIGEITHEIANKIKVLQLFLWNADAADLQRG